MMDFIRDDEMGAVGGVHGCEKSLRMQEKLSFRREQGQEEVVQNDAHVRPDFRHFRTDDRSHNPPPPCAYAVGTQYVVHYYCVHEHDLL